MSKLPALLVVTRDIANGAGARRWSCAISNRPLGADGAAAKSGQARSDAPGAPRVEVSGDRPTASFRRDA